ncbi:MAG TPA: molybdopterin-guanine dinucleotide biosynthesis protein MobB [Thermoanaerobaculia bacterium]
MHRLVVAFAGSTGSGKTTLIVRLVGHYTGRGESVGVIKHTHHPLNQENRGDTARFLDAGARVAILAGDGEAVVFSRDGAPAFRRFDDPQSLIRSIDAEIIFVEGFKSAMSYDRVELAGLVKFVDRIGPR